MSTSPATKPGRLGRPLAIAAIVLVAAVFAIEYLARPTAQVVVVTRGNAVDARPGSVTVAPGYSEDIKSESGGRLVDSRLEEGSRFRKGDFMAQIDTGDEELKLQAAINVLTALRRTHEVGSQTKFAILTEQDNLTRKKRQLEVGLLAQMDYNAELRSMDQLLQSAKLEEVNFQNQVDADELAIRAERRTIDKMTIRAPFDGTVSIVYARPGQIVGGGSPLATLISTDRTVEARISEEKFTGIRIGQPASVLLLGSTSVYDARVSKILPTAEAATQRYVVYLDVKIPQDLLMPGQTGECSIEVDRHKNAILAPRRAVIGNNVFVVNGGRVELRKVKLGFTSETSVEILDGLQEGELVIAEDLDRFSPGDHVRTQTIAD